MQDLNKLIDNILWAKSFVTINNGNNEPKSFILRSLSIKETNFVNYIYERELDSAINEGILSNDQLKRLFESSNIWTDANENEIFDLEKQEKILQSQIKDFEFITIKRKKAENLLKEVREKKSILKKDKINLFNLSAETRAEEVMRRYIIMLSAEDFNEKPYWPSEDEFLNESDFVMIYNLAMSYYKNNILDEKTIRKIARSPSWRIKWGAFKSGADLFGRAVPDWSEMQNYLVYWSQFYDFVYESLDRPNDSIIEDDESCDIWIKDQTKKIRNKNNGNKNMFGTNKAKTTKDHQEQFIMVDSGDKEAIQKIQEMNTSDTRRQIRNEYERIKKEGRISEWKLRGASNVKINYSS